MILANACSFYGQTDSTALSDSLETSENLINVGPYLNEQLPDSSLKIIDIKNWHRGTTVMVSQNYGIPQIVTESGSLHLTTLSVNSQLDLFKLPVVIDGYYTSQQPYTGFGSMVTVRLDVQELKKRRIALNDLALNGLKDKLSEIDKKIFDLESALSFQEGKWSRSNQVGIDRPTRPALPSDTSLKGNAAGYFGSLNPVGSELDSLDSDSIHSTGLDGKQAYRDSVQNSQQQQRAVAYEKIDSLAQLLESIRRDREMAANTLASAEEAIAANSNLLGTGKSGFAAKSADALKQLVLNANKLEVGMARPTNSVFLIRGLPLMGVHLETMHRNHYVSVSAGRLYNPRVFGTLTTESAGVLAFMGAPRRASQYNALQLKGGVGPMLGSHAHFGVLAANSVNFVLPERRTVYEGDFLLKTKHFTAQLTGARSNMPNASFEEQLSGTGGESEESQLFASSAVDGKLQIPIKRTKTTVTGNIAYTGSGFHSPGIGFQRPGLLMYRADAKQRLGKKTTVSAFYGREYDGLLINQASYNAFERWGASIQQKIGRSFVAFGEFSPIRQQVVIDAGEVLPDDPFSQLNADSISAMNSLGSSYLLNGGLNWTKRLGEITMSAYCMGQYYSLTAETGVDLGSYLLSMAMFTLDYAGKVALQMGMNLLKPVEIDGFLKDRNTVGVTGAYTMQSGMVISVGGELLQEGDDPMGLGYRGRVDMPLGNSFRLMLEASKLVNDRYSQDFLSSHFGMQDPFQIRTSIIWKI